jgi:hypothetical protein
MLEKNRPSSRLRSCNLVDFEGILFECCFLRNRRGDRRDDSHLGYDTTSEEGVVKRDAMGLDCDGL